MSNSILAPTRSIFSRVGLANFAVVCAIGGSTFLAIRLAVGPDSGFPPLWMAATRFTAASMLILIGMTVAGYSVKLPLRQLLAVLISGMLLWGGGNGLASIASRTTGAGLVAMFFAVGPLWVTALEALIDRKRPSLLGLTAMVFGLLGVILLVSPMGAFSMPGSAQTYFALLLAPLSYAVGVVVLRRVGATSGFFITAGWQMLGGAGTLWLAVLCVGEPIPIPSTTAWWAWGYLTLIGSIIGFTSFTAALHRLPTAVFMSHAWINPMVAAALGAMILGETLPDSAYAASGLILIGLILLGVASLTNHTQASGGAAQQVPLETKPSRVSDFFRVLPRSLGAWNT